VHRSFVPLLRSLPLLLVWAMPTFSQPEVATKADSSVAYATKHYPLLQVPQLLWTGLVYPLGQFTIYAERNKLPQRVNHFFTNEAGTFGLFPQVQLGGETGSGAGARIFHTQLFGADVMAEALFVYGGERGQTGAAFLGDESIAAGRGYWHAQTDWLQTRNESATVNGGWRDSNLRLLQLEQLDIVSTLGWRLHAYETESFTKNAFAEARIGFGRRRLTERFNVELPFITPGYTVEAHQRVGQGETIALFSAGVRLAYDDRDYTPPTQELSHPPNYQLPGRILHHDGEFYHSFRDVYNPEGGSLAELEFDFFSGNKDARFIKVGAEVQRFFTLFWRYRVLALRARLDKVSAVGAESIVPYTDLVTLGGSQRLRGYRRGALRGEGGLLLSAEYRWPIWDTWSAYLFWDEGQVFDRYGDIEGRSFLSSWGGGINLRTAEAFLIGVRIGHSKAEDALVGFTLEQEF